MWMDAELKNPLRNPSLHSTEVSSRYLNKTRKDLGWICATRRQSLTRLRLSKREQGFSYCRHILKHAPKLNFPQDHKKERQKAGCMEREVTSKEGRG
jgi:hypothetical protein